MRTKMDRDLETLQRERAEAVWRKRLAGHADVADPLTSEALVEQVNVRMAKLQADDFHAELTRLLGRAAKADEVNVVRAMAADPEVKSNDLARIAGVSESRVKRISLLLQSLGVIRRKGTKRRSFWEISIFRQPNEAN